MSASVWWLPHPEAKTLRLPPVLVGSQQRHSFHGAHMDITSHDHTSELFSNNDLNSKVCPAAKLSCCIFQFCTI